MFFFFKQKTAYEMRISDWSSDVCSSDLYVFDAAVDPGEADPPLIVDTDAVLSRSVALQSFQPIARRCAKVVEDASAMQVVELPERDAGNVAEGTRLACLEERCGVAVLEAPDHGEMYNGIDRKSTRLNSSH